jgi:phenylacetate-CoA ligase
LLDENGILITETSGTSGLPLRCPKSPADCVVLGAGIWRQRRRIDPFVTPEALYRYNHLSAAPPIEPRDCALKNLQALYADVDRTGSRWIHSSPSILLRHVATFHKTGWFPTLPNLKFIEMTGEFITHETISLLERTFLARVTGQYGMMETWTIALSCAHGTYHVNDENLHVEILDQADAPCPVGGPGQIVVTALRQRLLPIIRYMTNDYGMWVESSCDCSLGGRTLVLLNGRENELIAGDDQIRFGNTVFANAISQAHNLHNLNDLRHIRVLQTAPATFNVRTNQIECAIALCQIIREQVEVELGRPVQIDHTVLTEAAIDVEAQGKPWLFRRLM